MTSCGGDDDTADIVGKWEVVKFSATNCDDNDDNVTIDLSNGNCFDEDGIEVCIDIEFEFKSDGRLNVKATTIFFGTETSETTTYNYSIDGNSITVCEGNNDCSTDTYSVNGDTLNFKFEDEDNCEVTVTARRK